MHRTIEKGIGHIGDSPGLLVGVPYLAGVLHVALDCLHRPAHPAAVPPQFANELPGSGEPQLVALSPSKTSTAAIASVMSASKSALSGSEYMRQWRRTVRACSSALLSLAARAPSIASVRTESARARSPASKSA